MLRFVRTTTTDTFSPEPLTFWLTCCISGTRSVLVDSVEVEPSSLVITKSITNLPFAPSGKGTVNGISPSGATPLLT